MKGAVDQEAADAYGLVLHESEATEHQLALGRLFDSLIGNADRGPSDVLYLLSEERIFLIDHSEAFSTSPDLPIGVLESGGPDLTPALSEALRSLDEDSLEKELGDLLDGHQIAALLARRDKILAAASH